MSEHPRIELLSDSKSSELTFSICNVNVSIINAIRRIILSEIPVVVFKKATFIQNTCGLNNEIVNHRLKCIPIYIKNTPEFVPKNYELELHVQNDSDSTMVVTTADFKVKDLANNSIITEYDGREIFPPNSLTGNYIDFVRLKAKQSESFPSKSIHMTCNFEIGTAKEDGAFNVVSTCAYRNTIDEGAQESVLQKEKQKWKDEGKDVEFEAANWRLLEGKRIFKEDCFEFVLETGSVYSNPELLLLACEIMLTKLENFQHQVENNDENVKLANNTMLNSYDILLEGEDYTLGKVIEYYLLKKYFETGTLSFCGFKKLHPHDTYSLIRVAYKTVVDIPIVKSNLISCIGNATEMYQHMHKEFMKLVPR